MVQLTAREEVALRLLPALVQQRMGPMKDDEDRAALCEEALDLADVFLVAVGREARVEEPKKTDVKEDMKRKRRAKAKD